MTIQYVPQGAEFRFNSYTSDYQVEPAVAGLVGGGFVATWASDAQDGSSFGVYCQVYGGDGTPVGSEFRVNTYTTGNQRLPAITSLADGGFVVTWTSDAQDGNGSGVYGQVYSGDGSPVGSEFRVNTYTTRDQSNPSITSLADGRFVVTWSSDFQDGSYTGVYGQVYGGDGTPIGSEFQVNTYTSHSQDSPSITSLSDGRFVVTWVSEDQDGSSLGVYCQVYDGDGSRVGDEFRVNTYTTSFQIDPSITSLADGGFVVTWTSYGQDGSNNGVYGQVYGADGTPVGSEFRVNTYTSDSQYTPSITGLSHGGFVVTWSSDFQDGSLSGVYGQVYSGDGSPVGSEFRVNTHTFFSQAYPSISRLADGGFVVTWETYGQDGSGIGVYGQIFSPLNSDPLGTPSIVGTPTQGRTLSANISGVTDEDGINGSTVSYQWLRNGSDISVASGSSYHLTQADVGQTISVRYSYTDNYGTEESVVSAATAAVQNVNDAPTGSVVISGTARQGQTLTANVSSVTDADGINGPTIAYQWLRNDSVISGATGSSYTLTQADVGRNISVLYSYTDNYDTSESVVSVATAAVQNLNDVPTGLPSISGTTRQGQTLTANVGGIADADGIDGSTIAYQWLRNGSAISGATGSSYLLTQADVGRNISIHYSYTDNYGTGERVVSPATAAVQNVNDLPQGQVLISVMADSEGGSGTSASEGGGEASASAGSSGEASASAGSSGGASASAGSGGEGAAFEGSGGGASATEGGVSLAEETGSAVSIGSSTGDLLSGARIAAMASPLAVTEGQTLQADASGVSDADGINGSTVAYQWLRDGSAITGATRSTYTLTQADVGRNVSVRCSYTDNYGTSESVVSSATAAVLNDNALPIGSVTIIGTARQGQTLFADLSELTDADGINASTATYQWLRGGSAITGATGSSYTLTQIDVGQHVSVRYSYTDNYGTSESIVLAATSAVQNVNDAPAGSVNILGKAKVGGILRAGVATLADADGRGALSYQWLRDGEAIEGGSSSSSSYRITASDFGHQISVRVSYTDGFGQRETVTSARTAPISPSHNGTNGSDVITGTLESDVIVGKSGDDWISGGAGDDALYGGAGNDTIDDGTGDDTIDGGSGIDTLKRNYDFATDYSLTLEVNLETGRTSSPNFPEAKPDILISIENLIVTGRCSFVLTGNDVGNLLQSSTGNDFLNGNAGDDTLNGGGGGDTMVGGLGNDYFITDGGDTILEGAGQGSDTVQSSVAFRLGNNLEDLVLTGSRAVSGTGNSLENQITGNSAANRLQGLGGNDVLSGLAGSDTLEGGAGKDTLTGGKGNDRLIGGSGADIFVFNRGDGTDVITDFANGVDKFQIGTGAESFGDVTVRDSGKNAVISFADVKITLLNVDHRLIDAGDFVFA